MSYKIEFDRKIFWFGSELSKDYLFFVEEGSNNIIDNTTGKISRDWELICIGKEYELMQVICKRAGYTEGNILRYSNGITTPENYIKKYRNLIKNAKQIYYLLEDRTLKLIVSVYNFEDRLDYDKEKIMEYSKLYNVKKEAGKDIYAETVYYFKVIINKEQDLQTFFNLAYYQKHSRFSARFLK